MKNAKSFQNVCGLFMENGRERERERARARERNIERLTKNIDRINL